MPPLLVAVPDGRHDCRGIRFCGFWCIEGVHMKRLGGVCWTFFSRLNQMKQGVGLGNYAAHTPRANRLKSQMWIIGLTSTTWLNVAYVQQFHWRTLKLTILRFPWLFVALIITHKSSNVFSHLAFSLRAAECRCERCIALCRCRHLALHCWFYGNNR